MDRQRLSHFTAQEILELAARDNVLIRGWGATYLLRDIPHVVCVRVCAPMEFRVREMMRRLGIDDPAAARREIERSDAAHNGTMQRLFGADWTDATLYAAALNTARDPPAECVEQIVHLVESEPFHKTARSLAMLMDRLVEARVRSALRDRFDNSLAAMGIDVTVREAEVALIGAVSDDRVIADLVRTAAAVPGVARVQSQIRYLSFARNGL
jgi:cytidylate kinase